MQARTWACTCDAYRKTCMHACMHSCFRQAGRFVHVACSGHDNDAWGHMLCMGKDAMHALRHQGLPYT